MMEPAQHELPAPGANQVLIHAVLDHEPGAVWIHTHGMARFDCPDLECYWSPAATWRDGAAILNHVAGFVIASRPPIEEGQTASFEGSDLRVRFLDPMPQSGHGFGGNRVWRVQPMTTGGPAVEAFRRLVHGGRVRIPREEARPVALHLEGRLEEAAEEYRTLLERNPGDVHTLNNLGQLLFTQGKLDEAEALLQRAVATDPAYAPAHNNLGNVRIQRGDPEAALAAYQEAMMADPAYPMAYRNMGLTLHLLGRHEEAVHSYRHYLRLIEGQREDAEAHYDLGVVLAVLGRDDEAAQAYKDALAVRPAFARPLNNLGLLDHARGDLEQAREYYERALQADGKFSLARFNLAMVHAAAQRNGEAIRELERVAADDPTNRRALNNLAALYTAAGRPEQALAILAKLADADPRDATVRFNLALARQATGDEREAARDFKAVIALEPASSSRGRRARRELEKVAS